MSYLINNNQSYPRPIKQSVISKTPYRISLGGGGTDLPFYFKEREGFLVTASINHYMTISTASRFLDDYFLVQTTKTQFAEKIDELENDLIREALRYFGITKAIQVATYSTLPTFTGLGASSTLMVGLVRSLAKMFGKRPTAMEIAFTAHHIERNILKLSGGIQDQYIAALGGIQILKVSTSGEVSAQHCVIEEYNRHELERGLVLIYTGEERESDKIIQSQKVDMKKTLEIYDGIKEIGLQSVELLKRADVEGLGTAMDNHWKLKKSLSTEMTTSYLDELYIQLKKFGSPGGKIIGAGGGGFFLMAVPGKVDAFLSKVTAMGYRYLDWRFEFNGAHIIDKEP